MLKFVLLLITVLQGVRGGRLIEWIEKTICPPLNPLEPCIINSQNLRSTADDWKWTHPVDGLQRPLQSQSCSFSSYSAMGDSYSVGLGSEQRLEMCPSNLTIGSDTCTTDHCWKDIGAYPYRFAKQYKIPNFSFLACSGADSSKIWNTQLDSEYFNYPPNSQTPPALISLTAGGDDFSLFFDIVFSCILDPYYNHDNCANVISSTKTKLVKIATNLNALYAAINKKISNTKPRPQVVVMGMPQPFGTTYFQGIVGNRFCPEYPIDVTQKMQINSIVQNLNTITQNAAKQAGFLFAPTDALWKGHRWCDTGDSWLNYNLCRQECDTDGVKYNSVAYAHPFYDGQGAFLQAMVNALGCTPVIGGTINTELK